MPFKCEILRLQQAKNFRVRRVIQYLPALALTMGPCAAYLVWAVTRRKVWHTYIAIALNVALWVLGPLLLAWQISNLP